MSISDDARKRLLNAWVYASAPERYSTLVPASVVKGAHPTASRHLGFFVSECGLMLIYQSRECECCLWPTVIDMMCEDGERRNALAFPIAVFAHQDGPLRDYSNACIARSSRRPKYWLAPSHTLPSPGQAVFQYAQVSEHWAASTGHVIDIDKEQMLPSIEASISAFHGSCGAPLVTAAGDLVGFGAKIEMTAPGPLQKRDYERANFESVASYKIADLTFKLPQQELDLVEWRVRAFFQNVFSHEMTCSVLFGAGEHVRDMHMLGRNQIVSVHARSAQEVYVFVTTENKELLEIDRAHMKDVEQEIMKTLIIDNVTIRILGSSEY